MVDLVLANVDINDSNSLPQSSPFDMSFIYDENHTQLNPSCFNQNSLILSNNSVKYLVHGYLRALNVNFIDIDLMIIANYVQLLSKSKSQSQSPLHCEIIFGKKQSSEGSHYRSNDWCTVLFKPELSYLKQ